MNTHKISIGVYIWQWRSTSIRNPAKIPTARDEEEEFSPPLGPILGHQDQVHDFGTKEIHPACPRTEPDSPHHLYHQLPLCVCVYHQQLCIEVLVYRPSYGVCPPQSLYYHRCWCLVALNARVLHEVKELYSVCDRHVLVVLCTFGFGLPTAKMVV